VTDDDIEATKAPLIEHLIELRRRLIWTLLAVFIACLICFWFAKPIYNLLLFPYRLAAGADAPIDMIYTAPQEFFFTEVKLALFGAIFIAFPVIASQIYMFVAPGLYRSERQAFLPFLIATPILFLCGAALVYFVAMPLAMKFFLSMQQTGDAQVQIHLTAKVSEYLSLIMALILDPARPDQPDRAGSADRAPLRAVDLRGEACGEEARRLRGKSQAEAQTQTQWQTCLSLR
jgi:sec-independent protein translocase protein TatC